MTKEIVFTGGGSGGHVVPAITLIKKLRKSNPGIVVTYLGSRSGIERELITKEGIPFNVISTGKLRRYFSIENFIDLFRVLLGVIQSFFFFLGKSRKNTLVFSTGGFVTVPVVLGARFAGHKVFIHEQTSRAGLANKIASKFAKTIFISFDESKEFFPTGKTIFSGYPVRDECLEKKVNSTFFDGRDLANAEKPILFITGGGNGAKILNEAVWKELNGLKRDFLVIHQVGQKFIEDAEPLKDENYIPVAFVDNMIDMFKISTIVVSRAGAGTVCELISLGKPSIYVPLKIAQKNEQYHNAVEAKDKLGSWVIEEDDFLTKDFLKTVNSFYKGIRDGEIKQHDVSLSNASERILEKIGQELF